MYLVPNALGTNNSIIMTGKWGIVKNILVNAVYNETVYDHTVLGMGYLDCSNQTLSRIESLGPRTQYSQSAKASHVLVDHISQGGGRASVYVPP